MTMARAVSMGVLLLLASLWGWGLTGEAAVSRDQFDASDPAQLGRNAATTTLLYLRVQDLLRRGQTDEALSALDTGYLLQLTLLRVHDRELAHDELHIRARNRIVTQLKKMWLEHPPEYLDEGSAEFIETTCATLPDCPRGKIVPRKPIPMPRGSS